MATRYPHFVITPSSVLRSLFGPNSFIMAVSPLSRIYTRLCDYCVLPAEMYLWKRRAAGDGLRKVVDLMVSYETQSLCH